MSLAGYEWVATVRFCWSEERLCWKVSSDGHEVEHENAAQALSILFRRMRRTRGAPDIGLVKRANRGGEGTLDMNRRLKK